MSCIHDFKNSLICVFLNFSLGGTTCEIVPEDDPRFTECTEEQLPHPHVNFMKIKDVNDWWNWVMSMSLSNNFTYQIYPSDLPVLFMVRNY